jgi:hypothetical protein
MCMTYFFDWDLYVHYIAQPISHPIQARQSAFCLYSSVPSNYRHTHIFVFQPNPFVVNTSISRHTDTAIQTCLLIVECDVCVLWPHFSRQQCVHEWTILREVKGASRLFVYHYFVKGHVPKAVEH